MKKLRLLVTEVCDRQCPGCCNESWDLAALPKAETYADYDQILLTGGEPMLYPRRIIDLVEGIRRETRAPIYLYTAKVNQLPKVLEVLHNVDGITLTLHEQCDVSPFILFNEAVAHPYYRKKSLRLNVFEGVDLSGIDLSMWKVKPHMQWIKNCPLPQDEEFRRL